MGTLEYIGSIGGIGGVFGFLLFLSNRWLMSQMRLDRKFMEDRLTTLLNESFTIREKEIETIVKHTEVLTELTTLIKRLNGRP